MTLAIIVYIIILVVVVIFPVEQFHPLPFIVALPITQEKKAPIV